MDSRPTGSHNRNPQLVRIETDAFTMLLRGKPYHPTAEELGLTHPRACAANTLDITVGSYPLGVVKVQVYSPESDAMVDFEGTCPYPLFFENQDYFLSIRAKSHVTVSFDHESHIIRESVHQEFADLLSGSLNFRNEVGFTELIVRVDGIEAIRLCLEIFPAKMDYRTDYQCLLRDVEEHVYNLAYGFLGRTFQGVSPIQSRSSSLTEFFAMFRSVFRDLVAAIERIEQFPHHGLIRENRIIPASGARRWDRQAHAYLMKHPNTLVADDNGCIAVGEARYVPTKLPSTRKAVYTNTHENRFVRWMLQRIVKKVASVQQAYEQLASGVDQTVIEFLDESQRKIGAALQFGFLRDVDEVHTMTVTLALQLSPGYREIYRLYLLIMKGLQISSNLFRLSLKDLAVLYEYWCFLQLHKLLKERFVLVNEDVVRVHRDGLYVTLNKSKAAAFHYKNPRTGERITLVYNTLPPYVGPSPTVPQRPDTVLTIHREGRTSKASYIFDAKYRLNPALPGSSYARNYGTVPGPEEADINTMHRYRDAIVHLDEDGRYQRSMYGAYVLFPYADEERYRGHHFHRSIDSVNVGGLPFLPGATRLVGELLDRLLDVSAE